MSDFTELIPTSNTFHSPGSRKRNPKKESVKKDTWSSIKSKKEHAMVEPKGYYLFFSKRVRERLVGSKIFYNPKEGTEVQSAAEVLDVLKENSCFDESTAKAWVEWYVAKNIKPDGFMNFKLLQMRSMIDTWSAFAPVRPATPYPGKVLVEPKKSNSIEPPVRTIRQELSANLGPNPEDPKVTQALSLFGIVVVANYLLDGLDESRVADQIGRIIENLRKLPTGKHDVQMLFKMTARYSMPLQKAFLADWRERFKAVWEWANCQDSRVDAYYTKRAEDFFKGV